MSWRSAFVYFFFSPLGDIHAVKIGWSMDPRVRLREIQSYCPAQVWLQAVVTCESNTGDEKRKARELERHLHKKFSGARIHGEWFALTVDMNDYLKLCGEPMR